MIQRSAARGVVKTAVVVAACAVFIDHALRLSGPSAEYFDYGYNMKVNLAVAAFGYILWVCWLLTPYIFTYDQRPGTPTRPYGSARGYSLHHY